MTAGYLPARQPDRLSVHRGVSQPFELLKCAYDVWSWILQADLTDRNCSGINKFATRLRSEQKHSFKFSARFQRGCRVAWEIMMRTSPQILPRQWACASIRGVSLEVQTLEMMIVLSRFQWGQFRSISCQIRSFGNLDVLPLTNNRNHCSLLTIPLRLVSAAYLI